VGDHQLTHLLDKILKKEKKKSPNYYTHDSHRRSLLTLQKALKIKFQKIKNNWKKKVQIISFNSWVEFQVVLCFRKKKNKECKRKLKFN